MFFGQNRTVNFKFSKEQDLSLEFKVTMFDDSVIYETSDFNVISKKDKTG